MRHYVDYTRFSPQELSFIQLYYYAHNSKEKVMRKLRIQKSRFYVIKNRVEETVLADYRKHKLFLPNLPYPFEEEEKNPLQIAQEKYIKAFWKAKYDTLPPVRKSKLDRLEKKAWLSTKQ